MGLFTSQVLMVTGLKLADPVSASAWQPSQPIFTALLATSLGYETASVRKVFGILAAVAGAVFMVAWGAGSQGRSSGSKVGWVGHMFFALNCFGTSVYVIASKQLLQRYRSICVTAWSYMIASVMILAMVCCVALNPGLLSFFCTDKDPAVQQACVTDAWSVPESMLLPVGYWILFTSISSYALMTWANQYAQASVVSIYTVLQPFTSGCLSAVLVFMFGRTWAHAYGLETPGVQDLGVLGIALGLCLLFSDRRTVLAPVWREDQGDKRQALAESTAPPVQEGSQRCLLQA
mmetsp:Transcript_61001/g.191813  ORF Transcript_61001/g.191813 Transcript_61001/m.191813 type:complete len:291 (+) Transcript_61001:191-1063(+)